MAPLDLPRLSLAPVQLISARRDLPLIERPSGIAFDYGEAHAFIACLENVRVMAHGSIVNGNGIYVHGLTTGNYDENIQYQLGGYRSVPDGGRISGEHVLIWGSDNFGHWLITYLMRATLLWYRSELLTKSILLRDTVPKRFVEWLKRMGFNRIRFVPDGCEVEKLWVPSVVTYRGHYNDRLPYILPAAVHLMRRFVLREMILPHPVRERIYLSRAKSRWRRIANEESVVKVLESYGIRRVFMGELPLERQLDLISRAELVVVAAGADSPITMFAPADCKIVELSFQKFIGTFASRCWAHVLGQRFYRLNGELGMQSGPTPIDADYAIDVEKLSKMLAIMEK